MHCINDGSSKHIFWDSNFKEGWVASKGQLISKWGFSSKKTNENKYHSSKVEFVGFRAVLGVL